MRRYSRKLVFGAVGALGLLTLTSHANAREGIQFGPKGGLNWTSAIVRGLDPFTTNGLAQLTVGGVVSFDLSDALALRPEVLYSRIGFSSDDFDVEARIESSGVEVPVAFVAYLSDAAGVRPYLSAGPKVSFIGATREIFDGVEEKLEDDGRDVDFGILAGAGVEIPLGSGLATFDFRYTFGLLNLGIPGDDHVRLRSLQFLFAYLF